MESLSSKQLRDVRIQFRKSKKHIYLPESSLIGGKESTAMFTIAGMQQLIPYLSGKVHPLGKRLFNIQKCIRTVDIDEVGDASHLTFFEMMGNRSLGDYFKKEAVQRSREFLVDELGFDPKKLAVTVFEWDKDAPRDDETVGYRKTAGIPEDKIAYMPAENNRRSPGPVGPCGPDTEIFYRVGKATKLPSKDSNPKTDEDNRLEVWNNVFMEYYMKSEEEVSEEIKKNIDKVTEIIIWEAINIHKKYKDAITEKQIQSMLVDKLISRGLKVEKEKRIKIEEDGKNYWSRFADIVVNENIFIELKKTSNQDEIKKAFRQVRQYLNLNNWLAGLLLNFAFDKLGINRFNNFDWKVFDRILQTSKISPLLQKNIDTGMWFERMAKILQEKETVFDTDIFAPLIALIETTLDITYKGNERRCRIIADHIRTAFFLISHDIVPSNEGRWYVLRRLIRRMYYNFMLLKPVAEDVFDAFVTTIVTFVDALMQAKANVKNISATLIKETRQFQKTIAHGQKLLDEIIKWATKKTISWKDIFKLYDTFWFPLELTKEIVEEHWLSLDAKWFEKEMEAQQERSRAWSKDMFKQWIDWASHLQWIPPTVFVGYETLESDGMKLLKDFEIQWQRILVFDKSPFYAESGGQADDTWIIELDDGKEVNVVQVQKYNWIFLHFVE